METKIKTGPTLGEGIYTVPEAARILNMPYQKVAQWVYRYWNHEFKHENRHDYVWGEKKDRAFNFFTLIEIIAVYSFREAGVTFPKVKKAHKILSEVLKTPYPFATDKVLLTEQLVTDERDIFYILDEHSVLGLDEKLQISFKNCIAPYCQKIDFSYSKAQRFYPLGKDHDIVVDPNHSFGKPTVRGTNITAQAIYNMLKGGDSKELIASVYDIEVSQVEDVERLYERKTA